MNNTSICASILTAHFYIVKANIKQFLIKRNMQISLNGNFIVNKLRRIDAGFEALVLNAQGKQCVIY